MLTRDEIARQLPVSPATVKGGGSTAYCPAPSATIKANGSVKRRAPTPPTKCRVDVYLTAGPVTSGPISPMRCSMKGSPLLPG
jgi:hypothetical protein